MAAIWEPIDPHTPRGSLNNVPYPKATAVEIRSDIAFNAREVLRRSQRSEEGEVLIVGQQRPRTPTCNNLEQQAQLATETVQYRTP
jgi:hypothetical protein